MYVCGSGRRESARGEARQILSGGEIALLRIYCFKCNWVQPAPGEKIHWSLLSCAAESRLLICSTPTSPLLLLQSQALPHSCSSQSSAPKWTHLNSIIAGGALIKKPHNFRYLAARLAIYPPRSTLSCFVSDGDSTRVHSGVTGCNVIHCWSTLFLKSYSVCLL